MSKLSKTVEVSKQVTKGFSHAIYQAAIGFLLVAGVILISQLAYFKLVPGSWFLQSNEMEVVPVAQAGEAVPFRWCREPRHGTIDAKAVRVFYKLDNEVGEFIQVPGSQYEFPPNIENIDGCQNDLAISVARQPQVAGSYYFTTDLFWEENGEPKSIQERSSVYKLQSSPESLQNRINDLEEEIRLLEMRLQELNGSAFLRNQSVSISQ